MFKTVDDMPELPVSSSAMSWNRTGTWGSSTPKQSGKAAPCSFNCPAGEDIRGYLTHIKNKQFPKAFTLLTEANPFPAVCGRVCYHPCQVNCNRQSFDSEVQIRLVEKTIGDWGVSNDQSDVLPELGPHRVAIVGAGPAGLSAAYYLRRKGIGVVLYDENVRPGGILYYGIPSYRLDNLVLSKETDRALQGVEFQGSCRLGIDISIDDLMDYDAVFLAIGAHRSIRLSIPGDDLPGVESGLSLLKRINAGESVELTDKRVVVVGGGNTACDVARAAWREGASVKMIYRRTQAEMPAFAEEIEQLKSEPVELEFLCTPERIEPASDGRLTVRCIRMKQGELDDSGRARSIPIDGSQFTIDADAVLSAIGEETDLTGISGLQHDGEGGVDLSQMTSELRDKLFLGGDMLPNPRTVPHAVGSGRLAAQRIESFLNGHTFAARQDIVEVAGPNDINTAYFSKVNRYLPDDLHKPEEATLSTEQAAAEAGRCFSCGICFECDTCYNFCPDLAIIRTPGGYQANLDYCKGCGICVRECPSGSFNMGNGAPS